MEDKDMPGTRCSEPSDEALSELRRLSLNVAPPVAARRLWQRVLTESERQQLGGALELAYEQYRSVGIWQRLRGGSDTQAVVEIAIALGFTDRAAADWLLRELGEPELDTDLNAIDDAPDWDKERRELCFRGKVIRRIKRPVQAKNLVLVLDAFQELSWPPRIDDPIPDGPDPERLRKSVESLNKDLHLIRFFADGTGQGIIWRPI